MRRLRQHPLRHLRHTVKVPWQVVRERDFKRVSDATQNLFESGMLVGPADPDLKKRLLVPPSHRPGRRSIILSLVHPFVLSLALTLKVAPLSADQEVTSRAAQPGNAPAADTADSPLAAPAEKPPKRETELRLKGRLYARAKLQRYERTELVAQGGMLAPELIATDSLDLSIKQARFGARYELPQRWLRGELEFDVSGNPELKDGFIEVNTKRVDVRLGQFKMPLTALRMDSSWNLARMERGFLHDLLENWLEVGGRRPGVAVRLRGKKPLRPTLWAGAFQGSFLEEIDQVTNERDTELIDATELGAQSLMARASIELGAAQFGAFFEYRTGSPTLGETDHYPLAGLDLMLDWEHDTGGLRVWADVMAGQSWFVHQEKSESEVTFGSLRSLVAYRFGGLKDDEFYVEPFLFFGALDPDLEVSSDKAWEFSTGVNVGFWDRARIMLEAHLNKTEESLPGGGPIPQSYGFLPNFEQKAILLQAGVAL